MVQFNEDKQVKQLDALHRKEEERLVEILSQKYNIPFITILEGTIDITALPILTEDESRDADIAIYAAKITPKKKDVEVAFFSPNNPNTQSVIKKLEAKGYNVIQHMTTHVCLERVWDHYAELSMATSADAGVLRISGDELNEMMKRFKTIDDVTAQIEEIIPKKIQHKMSRIFEVIMAGAFAIGASDIHTEPREEGVLIRYRLDGILQDIIVLDLNLNDSMVNRIKLLSGLKLNVKNDTQDGRYSIMFRDVETDIRTSILPSNYGESVVMRILDPASISVPIEELGITPFLLDVLFKEIARPTGMILTTGPTGSGKTTTLYAFLKNILNPEIKIITIEDPVEYHIKGVVQSQVSLKGNFNFLSGLRAALRQDPDIIMVGEIRDGDTAAVAVNSALTGHLVLSTLHTNNAAGTIPRLIDLGVNPKVISAALNVSMAQRLIRRLCKHCTAVSPTTAKEKGFLEEILKQIHVKQPKLVFDTNQLWRASEVGCDKCNHTGYKGRVGIYEAILMDDAIEAIVASNPSEKEIFAAAVPQGIFDLREDGVAKILEGKTTLEELNRVVDLYKEFESYQ